MLPQKNLFIVLLQTLCLRLLVVNGICRPNERCIKQEKCDKITKRIQSNRNKISNYKICYHAAFGIKYVCCPTTFPVCQSNEKCIKKNLCPEMKHISKIENIKSRICGNQYICCPDLKKSYTPHVCGPDENCLRRDICLKSLPSPISQQTKDKINKNTCALDMRKSLINKRQYTCCPKPGNGNLLPTNKICGQKPPGYRIAGGNESAPNEFPWMALLLYKIRLSLRQELVPKCAGSLITTRYILTAAHCIDKETYWDFELRSVRLGEHDLSTKIDCVTLRNGKQLCSPPHVDIEVEKVILHEAYKNTTSYENDIGLVRVISPVTYTDVIKPICILENHISLANSILQIAGWGRKENQEKTEVLLRAYIKEERYYCWGKPDFLPQTEICAGGQNGEDTCVGDSGGPLMATIGRGEEEVVYAAGITSHGYENYKCGEVPAIYTKTGVFYKWIKQHLRP